MINWVLLRGLAREARHWGGFPGQLQAALPQGHRVRLVDLPGNGALCGQRSPASVAELVRAARAAYGSQPCVLVALSLGGMVAHAWAAQDPQGVRGCVLINTSMGSVAPFWQRLRPASYPALLSVLRPGRDALQRERAILRLTSNLPVSEAMAQAWATHARTSPVTRGNFLRQLVAAGRYRSDAGPPAVPTLLLASTHDRLVSVECSRRLAEAWGLPLREHGFAGHDLPLDDPEWVVDAIARWQAALRA
jgi:pimeloyl-ACP methyl ester carboxylesterase